MSATADMNEHGLPRRVGDRYRLEGLIGRGGAGAVWRAYDERLRRPVAVKEILWPVDPREFGPERALREARAAARLRDPGVVQIYDVIAEADRAHLVMELVDAPSLDRLVEQEGPLPPRRAAALGLGILSTLSAAHAAGIVHRDVKPSNVLVEGDVPRLTDFGIARLVDDPALTATGTVMGTPSYIAPEQARGAVSGPPADLYGLAATLYFAVEGVPPFAEENSLQTAVAVVSAPHRPMQQAGALRDLLEALLQKDPAARPDAKQVRQRLQTVADGLDPAAIATAPLAPDGSATAAAAAKPLTAAGARAAQPAGGEQERPHGAARAHGRRLMAVMAGLLAIGLLVLAGMALLTRPEEPVEDQPPATPGPEAGDEGPADDAPAGDAPAEQPPTDQDPADAPGEVATPEATPGEEGTPDPAPDPDPGDEPPVEGDPGEDTPGNDPPDNPSPETSPPASPDPPPIEPPIDLDVLNGADQPPST